MDDIREVEIFEKLGTGAFGAVFRGSYKGMIIAVKQVRTEEERILDDEEYDAFLFEGKIMLQLQRHPNVISVEWLCVNKDTPAILMEFAPLGTLSGYLQNLRENLPLETILKLVKGTAAGLSILHKHALVHRDVAARNILLGENLVPKVSDFGLSRECQKEGSYSSRGLHALPIKWMAPEALSEEKFSSYTDMWSFGIVVWEIITRDTPHKDMDISECTVLIRDSYLTPPIPTEINTILSDILNQCWYPDAEMRMSAKDVVEYIDDYT
jgi:serine/threonine protein kinase